MSDSRPFLTELHIRVKTYDIVLDEKYVTGRMWMESLDKASFHLTAEFLVNDEVRCTATQRGAFVDSKKKRIIRIPERMAEQFELGNS